MSGVLKIAKDLSLPLESVTQTFAVLAKRGAGKTNTAVVLAEELLQAGQQVVIVDPTGVWFGLRASSDGTKEGFPITVLGGEHGDLPLEDTAGKTVADFVVDHGASIILSLRHLSISGQRRFVADFCEQLYDRKGQSKFQQPLQLIIDEADEFAPQRIPPGGERMFGAVDRIVRRGRSAGLGVTLISQRAAVLNKDVLTQIEVLICLRTISPQDRKSLEAWIEAHDAHDQRKEFLASLPSLAIGEAWVWSPGWLDIFQRVQIRLRKTFDSSATPKSGERRIEPRKLAAVDLGKLRDSMAATIERAKADDPRELRKKIAELEKGIKKSPPADPGVIEAARKEAARAVHEQYQFVFKQANIALRGAGEKLALAASLLTSVEGFITAVTKATPSAKQPPPLQPISRMVSPPATSNGNISGGLRRMLIALAQRPQGLSARQLGVRAGLSSSSGTFGTYLSKGRSDGLLSGSRDLMQITPEGMSQLGSYDPLPTGRDLLAYWTGQLGGGASRMLEVLADAYPKALSKSDLGAAAGLASNSGTFGTYLSKLRTLELIEGSSELRISEELA